MFERVKSEKTGENMKDDEELDMLLGEIPYVTSHNIYNPQINGHLDGGIGNGSFVSHSLNGMTFGMNDDDPLSHYRYTSPSPVSGFSLHSDGSSSSLISSGYSPSDYGSPTPSPLEEIKSQNTYYPDGSMFHWKVSNSRAGKNASKSLIDEFSLSSNLKNMDINEEPEDVSVDPDGFLFCDRSRNGANRLSVERHSDSYRNLNSGCLIQPNVAKGPKSFNSDTSSTVFGMQQAYGMGNPLGSQYMPSKANCQSNCGSSPMGSPHHSTKDPAGCYWQMGSPALNLTSPVTSPSAAGASLCARRNGMSLQEERGASNLRSHLAYTKPHFNVEKVPHYYPHILDGRMRVSNNRIPLLGLEDHTEDSLIIPGEAVNYMMKKGFGRSKGHYKTSLQEINVGKPHERRTQLNGCLAGNNECGRNVRIHCLSMPSKFNNLAEARGYIYLMAKDQHGCRFLQRIFDEGTPLDVQIIFDEIIDYVVDLMMNPFGNYLMQKLLEVCNEEQRMQILLVVTEQPNELVRISLNTHGTRVVQKLIETLKTRQQISLVISAIEPGFLILIKDLNGNHVVQRCLQCLSNEDNKFIVVAAAKYCVEVATHQHGCCVLQRCISHSMGELRDNLVAEISSNGLVLAQDAFGNYVIQFIVEQKIPYAISKLVALFEGNFVHLSTQKFSSHVVEKCLLVLNDDVRSKIINELLSASHFEQLLQDPHANYVVQTALRVAEGPLHNALVEAIESHKATSRNNPYSKRIFSHKLLKK